MTLLAGSAGCRIRPAGEDTGHVKGLSVQKRMSLNSVELSGLTRDSLVGGAQRFLSISDSRNEILEINPDASRIVAHGINAGRCPAVADASQFEAIVADKDRIFVLQESSSLIFVLSGEDFSCQGVLTLTTAHDARIDSDWKADPNSRGEGFLLLKNGHIIVAKEKDPVTLVEFAPMGEGVSGFRTGDAVTGRDVFPMPRGSDTVYSAIKSWPLSSNSEFKVADISDLAIGPDGSIYALSDQSNGFGKIDSTLRPDEKTFKVKSFWQFPKKIIKPEGLSIGEDSHIYVTTDGGEGLDNFFVLDPF